MTHIIWVWLIAFVAWFTPDRIIAVATAVYAIVTLVMFRSINSQSKAAHRQADIAERAAKAAEKAAVAAQDSVLNIAEANRINRESLQSVQRAFIIFTMDFTIVRLANEDGKTVAWRFQLAIENTGNTPAKEVRNYTNWRCELSEDFPFPDLDDAGNLITVGSGNTLPVWVAGKSKIFSFPHDISHEYIRRAEQGQGHLYFWGWASYRDVFEGTPVHHTEFCYEVLVLGIRDDTLLWTARTFARHNSSD